MWFTLNMIVASTNCLLTKGKTGQYLQMRLLPRKRRSNIRQMCPNMSKLQAGYLFPEGKANFVRQCGAKPGDLILFGVGPANKTLDSPSTLWVTDFPMFEWNEPEQTLD
ncbi:hypothetical protein Bca52824_011876 [Brassica carinata]|uniref:Uncharacterized protein n=1 Tax=Brassica carinata TaxID=52824 RepID=A0A8X7VUY7_BRACI|nr:hypothetical protein Bca52824_011876 [Brassica carinata]